jgi:hypothetical protein
MRLDERSLRAAAFGTILSGAMDRARRSATECADLWHGLRGWMDSVWEHGWLFEIGQSQATRWIEHA